MKKFLFKVLTFSICCLLVVILVFSIADGKADPYYIRFTTPKQSSLILGTSRAAQGVQPHILNKIMAQSRLPYSFFNYSFTLGNSPFGPVYYRSIQQKLDTSKKNGCFIVTVDPWSISTKNSNPNDSTQFEENSFHLAKVNDVNAYPNFEYLIKAYDGQYINIIRSKFKNSEMFLHKDGWLEVSPQMDSTTVRNNIQEKIKLYKTENLPFYRYSKVRFNYFLKTLQLLKKYGHVYVLRLPVSSEMEEVEDLLMADFDRRIDSLSEEVEVPYLSFRRLPNNYTYTDGNHLYKESGKKVTEIIANWIKSNEVKTVKSFNLLH